MVMPKMDNPLKKEIDFKSLLKKSPNGGSPLSFSKKKPINHVEEVAKFSPGLPIVNLMPDAVLEEYDANDLKSKFIKIGLGLIGVFAAIWIISFVLGGINQTKIDSISNQTSNISQQLRSLTPYATYRTEVQAKRTALATQMAQEIDPGKINAAFGKIASDAGFTVSSLSVTVSSATPSNSSGTVAAAPVSGGTCVNPDPFNSVSGIGCLTFSLTPNAGASLTDLYAGLNKADSGFVNAYIPKAVLTAGTGTGKNTIDGSASFADSFYTKAYATYTNPIDAVLSNPANKVNK
jgi:outer membrane murein-binding lipoprotein Lpp